jgi:fucose 4-O-acetylase-like acetyltransferase
VARRLLLLAGIAVTGVILFHGAGWGFTAMFAWAHRYLPAGADLAGARTEASYAAFRVIEQLAVFSVPAFLFISGFYVVFATPRAKPGPAWEVLRPRLVWLIVPYLIWNAVVFVGFRIQGTSLTLPQFVRLILTGAGTPAYYYIPALVQLYLLSPLLVRWAKRSWPTLLLATALCQAAISLAPYLIVLGTSEPSWIAGIARIPSWFFVVHVFWFSLEFSSVCTLPRAESMRLRWWTLGSAAVLLIGLR